MMSATRSTEFRSPDQRRVETPPLRRRVARAFAPLAAMLALLVLAGCKDKDKVVVPDPEPSPYLAPTSPHNLLDNLRTAIELRDIDAYAALFDESEFTFHFDPVDLSDQPDLPELWGYVGEVLWATNAFGSADVLDISLAFMKGAVSDAESSDGEGVQLTWKKATITAIELEIETKNPQNPTDPIFYKVSGDRGQFFFAVDPDVVVDGEPTWKIVRWKDIRVGARPGAALTINHSFGQIKSVFR